MFDGMFENEELEYDENFEDMGYEEILEKVSKYKDDLEETNRKLEDAEDLSVEDWYEIINKNKHYQEELDITLDRAMNQGIEKFDLGFLEKIDLDGDLGEEKPDLYELADKILEGEINFSKLADKIANNEIDEEDVEELLDKNNIEELENFQNYVNTIEGTGVLIDDIDDKISENKGYLAKKGKERYREKGDLVPIMDGHYEASIASIMALMEDRLGKEVTGYKEIEEVYEFYKEQKEAYEEQKQENDTKYEGLPPLTMGMLAGLPEDKELRDKCLLSYEALNTEIKDASDLMQFYEIIDGVENPDNPLKLKGSLAAGIVAGLLVGGAASGLSALPEDSELEWNNGPTLAEYRDLNTDITGEATQENLTMTGTVEGGEAEISLEPRDIGGNLALEDTEGNIYINETDGHIEFGTGNVTQIINETEGNIRLNETEGQLTIDEGELAGTWEQVDRSELDAEIEEIDLDIDAESQGEQKTNTSLVPYLTASIFAGGAAGVAANKLNKIEKKDDEDLAEFVTRKYIASSELNEAVEEAYQDFFREMKDWEKKDLDESASGVMMKKKESNEK